MEKASPPPQQLPCPLTTVPSLSTSLSFVIPSEAEGSAVPRTPNKFLVLWVLGLASSPREEPWSYKNLCLGWSGTADPSASLGMTKRRGWLKGRGPLPRDRAVVGAAGDAPFPSTTALFIDITPLCEIKKSKPLRMRILCEF